MPKFAIILQAQPGDMGRAVHGLIYSKDLREAGHQVKLVFDGAGTTWIKEFEKSDHMYHMLYQEVKKLSLIAGACEHCSRAFKVEAEVVKSGVPFIGDYGGHPSVSKLVQEGNSLITL